MIQLKNEPTYEYNKQQRVVRVGEISGMAKIIKSGAYILVRLLLNGEFYLIK